MPIATLSPQDLGSTVGILATLRGGSPHLLEIVNFPTLVRVVIRPLDPVNTIYITVRSFPYLHLVDSNVKCRPQFHIIEAFAMLSWWLLSYLNHGAVGSDVLLLATNGIGLGGHVVYYVGCTWHSLFAL